MNKAERLSLILMISSIPTMIFGLHFTLLLPVAGLMFGISAEAFYYGEWFFRRNDHGG